MKVEGTVLRMDIVMAIAGKVAFAVGGAALYLHMPLLQSP